MSRKRKKIIVTALILSFVIIFGLAFGYWYMGYRHTWGKLCVTYFSDSVLGLVEDTYVTYKGVPVGHVHQIRIARDGKHVEVLFELYPDFDFKQDMVAQLEAFGTTGGLVLGLDKRKPGEKLSVPEFISIAPYSVIASRPSKIPMLDHFSTLNEKLDQLLAYLRKMNSQEKEK